MLSSVCAVNLTVLGKDYSLYTHVHHSYGLNDAFDRSVAYLLKVQQSEQLDSNGESVLHNSVQQKPLDQDATAVVAEGSAQGEGRRLDQDESPSADMLVGEATDSSYLDQRTSPEAATEEAPEGRMLDQDESSPATPTTVEAAEGSRLGQDESLAAQLAATAEAAEVPRLGQDESFAPASAAAAYTEHRRRLSVISEDKRFTEKGVHRHLLQHSVSMRDHHQTGLQAIGDQHDTGSHTSLLQPNMAGARSRSMLQEVVKGVEHPCLHEGYFKNYAWVAHGAHVGPLPRVHLVGR